MATQRKPASLAGVTEDHRYEQFFYNEQTSNELYQLVELYNRPILLCNPTLAVLAEKKGQTYKLLDRDTRFNFLSGYEQFSLAEPHLIANYEHDAIFIDPPFANITPMQIATCLQLMVINNNNNNSEIGNQNKVHLYVAYNSRREKKLLEAMDILCVPKLVQKWR